MSHPLIQGLVAILSGVAGYGFGWLSRGIAMDDLKKRRDGRRPVRASVWWALGSVALVALALVGLFTLVSQASEQRQIAECVRTEIRAERAANIALSNATLTMLDGVLSPTGTVESRTKGIQDWREAYRQYLNQLKEVDARHCFEE